MGLPHFRTSRVSRELYEPVYQNLFTVEIQLPRALTVSDDDKNLLLEGVTKVSGLDTNKNPGLADTQKYKSADKENAECCNSDCKSIYNTDYNILHSSTDSIDSADNYKNDTQIKRYSQRT